MSRMHASWVYKRPHRRRPPVATALFIVLLRAVRRANARGNVVDLDTQRKEES